MKKFFLLGCVACAALFVTGCKSKESAYKAAYERAQQSRQTELENGAATVVPTVQAATDNAQPTTVTPVTPVTTVTPTTPATDPTTVPVRVEAVTLVKGDGLKQYNVVCGSFGVQTNAEKLQAALKAAGYPAQIVINPANNMYRVIATTHGDKPSAVLSRDALRAKYPDAWLLMNN